MNKSILPSLMAAFGMSHKLPSIKLRGSKYMPHQGHQECARRRKQMGVGDV